VKGIQMKAIIITIVLAAPSAAFAQSYNYGTGSNSESHYVDGYTNNRGTYVQPHYQTNPNTTTHDNYGASGNYNYHNGRTGHGW
jgi:hypothetical protein